MSDAPRPRLVDPFVTVYRPQPDVFPGPDSESFVAGQRYEDWVPNDHTIVKGPDGRWHAFGITHPAPPAGAGVHEAEWMAFHAAAGPGALGENLRDGAWEDLPKVLAPASRPDERKELYAPFVIERDGVYHMIYGPTDMRLATSTDLFDWTPQGALFTQDGGARDPCVLLHDGRYIIVYVAHHTVFARTSPDLRQWDAEPVEIFRMTRPGTPESPVLIERDGSFYLLWCIYDGTNGSYDNRTFVYRSDDALSFIDAAQVSAFEAHAPEVVQDTDGEWFVSSVEWPRRGMSLAMLEWV